MSDLKTLTLYQTLELQSAGGPCQVIVNMWETHHRPRTMSPTGIDQQKMVQGLVGLGLIKCVILNPPLNPPFPILTVTCKHQCRVCSGLSY